MSQPKPTAKERVRAHRERMRAKGLRPVTVWAFDRSTPEREEQLRIDCEAIAHAERTNPEAKADAEWAYAATDAMLRHLDETEPYDWGPNGPPI